MNKKMNMVQTIIVMIALLVQLSPVISGVLKNELSLDAVIAMAKANDPWLKGSEYRQLKLEAMAVAAGQLQDPTMSVGIANLGADRFNFSQEPMTQFKVGLTQMFPKGKTRAIRTEQINLLAGEQPLLRRNRQALITRQASLYWLDAYQARKSIELIQKDRPLFQQLIDLVEASYSSGFGQTRQQDLIRAQLELTRLDDRLTVLRQAAENSIERLGGMIAETRNSSNYLFDRGEMTISLNLPEIITRDVLSYNSNQLMQAFLKHPAVSAMDIQIDAESKGVELAQQKYKPAWGLNASYGYRGDAESNINRADLFSIGVTLELPIFTKNRQDQQVKAAILSVDAKETQKSMLLREMAAEFDGAKSQLLRLIERQTLYEKTLLPQMQQQAEASLNAYTHDDGDFAEVIRARIAELNAQIDALDIQVEIAKTKTEINYLLDGSETRSNFNQPNDHGGL